MKRRTTFVLIGIWITGALLLAVAPAGAAEGKTFADSIRPVQSEGDLAPDPSSALIGLGEGEGRVRLDSGLRFETGTRKTTTPEREAEALRFHHNTVLERFENADSHGQVFLTFSADRIELSLRSITGAEAPVADVTVDKE